MATYTMTVHKALAELKVLGARIEKEIGRATFVTTNQHANTKIAGKSVTDYMTAMKADYQSISDLIARRSAIKRAVTISNATTTLTINHDGKVIEMTVAEAIEFKTAGIEYKQRLLNAITRQYNNAVVEQERNNGENLENRANDYIHGLFGGKEKEIDSKAVDSSRDSFIKNNTLDLIDPIGAAEVIKKLSDEIDFFNSEVDAALSVSNATHNITFDV